MTDDHFQFSSGLSDEDLEAAGDLCPIDRDQFMYAMARFMLEGDEREELRLLLQCEVEAWEQEYAYYSDLVLEFSGPRRAYLLLSDSMTETYSVFARAAEAVRPRSYNAVQMRARAQLPNSQPADWCNELLAVLDGKDVDNQAVGFKATKTWEGLRFRSESEVRIARALDEARVMFLPNCRARLGSHPESRRNLEADFIVFLNDRWGVLEVDGAEWHNNRAAEDHERDRPFKYHGASVVERFPATECYSDASRVVAKFLTLLKRS